MKNHPYAPLFFVLLIPLILVVYGRSSTILTPVTPEATPTINTLHSDVTSTPHSISQTHNTTLKTTKSQLAASLQHKVTPTPTQTPTLTATSTSTPNPTATRLPTQTPIPEPTFTPSPAIYSYRLRPGDSLHSVAMRAEISLDELVTLNHLEDSDFVRQGQMILLPAGSTPPEQWPLPTPKAFPTFVFGTEQSPVDTPLIHLGRTDSKQIALTFDIGYYPQMAIKVARYLEEHNVQATFFVIGFALDAYPELVHEIVDSDHELGNHSWSHGDMRQMTVQEIQTELAQTEQIVQDTVPGATTKPFFRAPFGYVDPMVIQVAQQEGYYIIDWSLDSMDWIEGITAPEVTWTVTRHLRPGAIICLHASSTATLEALPHILEAIEQKGYQTSTLSELFTPDGAKQVIE